MNSLPIELQTLILSKINILDYYSTKLTCHRFRDILDSNFFKLIWSEQKLFNELKENKNNLNNSMKISAIYGKKYLVDFFIEKVNSSEQII